MVNIKGIFLKSAIALSLFALYGCDNAPDDNAYDAAKAQKDEDDFVNNTANAQTREDINKSCQELVPYLKKMREQDPAVMEVYYGSNNGVKEIHIVRADRDITNVSTEMCDANDGRAYVTEKTSSYTSTTRYIRPSNNTLSSNNGISDVDESTHLTTNGASGVHGTDSSMPQAHSSPTFTDHVYPVVGGVAAGYMLSQYVNAGKGNGINYLNNNYQHSSYQNLNDEDRRKRRGVATSSYISFISNNNKNNIRNGIKTGQVKMPTTSRSYQSKNLSTRTLGVFKSSGGARSGGYSGGG